MPKHFPDRLDPWRLFDGEQVIQGTLPLASMGRLSPLLNDGGAEREADFSLSFSRDQGKRAIIRCKLSATLLLTCQYCLGSMHLSVEVDSSLALVRGIEEAESLPEELEPVMLAEDGLLSLGELLEDELLLAIPDAPRHSGDECKLNLDDYRALPEEESAKKPNPFEILSVLKDGD